jgi:hypothetical protein
VNPYFTTGSSTQPACSEISASFRSLSALFGESIAALTLARMAMQVPLPLGLLFSVGCVATVGIGQEKASGPLLLLYVVFDGNSSVKQCKLAQLHHLRIHREFKSFCCALPAVRR